jgi:Zn-dependent protease
MSPVMEAIAGVLQAMAILGILLNLYLAVFNLLPIPPLDGSHVVKYLLPPSWALRYQQIGFYGILILLLLLTASNFTRFNPLAWWLSPATNGFAFLYKAVLSFVLPTTFQWLGGVLTP